MHVAWLLSFLQRFPNKKVNCWQHVGTTKLLEPAHVCIHVKTMKVGKNSSIFKGRVETNFKHILANKMHGETKHTQEFQVFAFHDNFLINMLKDKNTLHPHIFIHNWTKFSFILEKTYSFTPTFLICNWKNISHDHFSSKFTQRNKKLNKNTLHPHTSHRCQKNSHTCFNLFFLAFKRTKEVKGMTLHFI